MTSWRYFLVYDKTIFHETSLSHLRVFKPRGYARYLYMICRHKMHYKNLFSYYILAEYARQLQSK